MSQPVQIKFQESPCWCSISYYEFDQRIGEAFNAIHSCVVVSGYTDLDGYSDWCEDYFCLGLLFNPNRVGQVCHHFCQIGRGVQLVYVGGKVFVECLNNRAISVQSRCCNYSNDFHPTTVCKVPPGCSLEIFNDCKFAQLLAQSVNQGFEAVFELTKLCTIYVSLTKHWGSDDTLNVTSTPCWIEISLNGPLLWLDRVLTQIH